MESADPENIGCESGVTKVTVEVSDPFGVVNEPEVLSENPPTSTEGPYGPPGGANGLPTGQRTCWPGPEPSQICEAVTAAQLR